MRIILAVLMGLCLVACSNNFEKAREAYNKGDYKTAAPLYEKACNNGNATACFNIGLMYAQSKGVKEDYSKAAKFFKKACDMGDEDACDLYWKANALRVMGGFLSLPWN